MQFITVTGGQEGWMVTSYRSNGEFLLLELGPSHTQMGVILHHRALLLVRSALQYLTGSHKGGSLAGIFCYCHIGDVQVWGLVRV